MKKKALVLTLVAAAAAGAAYALKRKNRATKNEEEEEDEEEDMGHFTLRNPYSPYSGDFGDIVNKPGVRDFQVKLLEVTPITTQIIWRHPSALKALWEYKEAFSDGHGNFDHDIYDLFDEAVDDENLNFLIALCYRLELLLSKDRN